MKNLFLKAKDLTYKIQDKCEKIALKISCGLIGLQSMALCTMPVSAENGGAVTIKNNIDIASAVGGILGIVMQIAFYVGIAMIVGGAFTWLMAYQGDDSERQSRSVKVLVVGGALTSLRILLTTAGIIG